MSVHLHIVPSIPPAFNGLGDYCYQLWKHWPTPRPEWHVAAAEIPEGAREAWPEVKIHGFEPNADSLKQTLLSSGASKVILHYVGYGYEPRGVPTWLPKALEDWKKASGGKLVVMFHELYATGPPWKSEFWLCLTQKRIAGQLAKLADRWITSCPRYMRVLVDILGAKSDQGEMIPVGSNIEPVEEPDWNCPWPIKTGQKLVVAIFGMPITRWRAANKHQGALKVLASQEAVGEIRLIGRSDSDLARKNQVEAWIKVSAPTASVTHHYDLPRDGVSKALSGCHLGLIENPYSILYKSGSYAAYAVHALLPLIPEEKDTPPGLYFTGVPDPSLRDLSSAFESKAMTGKRFEIAAMSRQFHSALEKCA